MTILILYPRAQDQDIYGSDEEHYDSQEPGHSGYDSQNHNMLHKGNVDTNREDQSARRPEPKVSPSECRLRKLWVRTVDQAEESERHPSDQIQVAMHWCQGEVLTDAYTDAYVEPQADAQSEAYQAEYEEGGVNTRHRIPFGIGGFGTA